MFASPFGHVRAALAPSARKGMRSSKDQALRGNRVNLSAPLLPGSGKRGLVALRVPLYEALFVKLLVAPFVLVLIHAVPRRGRFDANRR